MPGLTDRPASAPARADRAGRLHRRRRRPRRGTSRSPRRPRRSRAPSGRGRSIIRWQSSGRSVALCRLRTTGSPIVRFGHEVRVHDVDVQPVGVRDRVGLVGQVGEVGRQDARRDHRLGPADAARSAPARLTTPNSIHAVGSARRAQQREEHGVGAVPVRPQLHGRARRRGRAGRRTAAGRRRRSCPATDVSRSRPGAASRSRRRPARPDGRAAAPRRAARAAARPARSRRPACAASGPRAAGAARPSPSTGRRAAPGHSRRRSASVRASSTSSSTGQRRVAWATSSARCGRTSFAVSCAPRGRAERGQQRRLAAGPGAQVEPARVAARRAAHRPARWRTAGCLRPARRRARAIASRRPGRRRPGAPRTATTARARPVGSATSSVAVEPARDRRRGGCAAARRRRPAPARSRPGRRRGRRRSAARSTPGARTAAPAGAIGDASALSRSTQPSQSSAATRRSTALTKPLDRALPVAAGQLDRARHRGVRPARGCAAADRRPAAAGRAPARRSCATGRSEHGGDDLVERAGRPGGAVAELGREARRRGRSSRPVGDQLRQRRGSRRRRRSADRAQQVVGDRGRRAGRAAPLGGAVAVSQAAHPARAGRRGPSPAPAIIRLPAGCTVPARPGRRRCRRAPRRGRPSSSPGARARPAPSRLDRTRRGRA